MDNQQRDNMQTNTSTEQVRPVAPPNESSGIYLRGHIKIHDPESGEVFVDKTNAIHYENFSVALASMIAHKNQNYIYQMDFGNGGTSVDLTGIITYLPTNTVGQNSNLYNPTYSKIVDDTSASNLDPINNKITINHIPGKVYTDIVITCRLDYNEPNASAPNGIQSAFDNSQNLNDVYVFDELGLRGRGVLNPDGTYGTGPLLTHVVFHPVQKSANRLIQIDYTVRVQTLTNLSTIG
jgi:hypothetical protein